MKQTKRLSGKKAAEALRGQLQDFIIEDDKLIAIEFSGGIRLEIGDPYSRSFAVTVPITEEEIEVYRLAYRVGEMPTVVIYRDTRAEAQTEADKLGGHAEYAIDHINATRDLRTGLIIEAESATKLKGNLADGLQ